MSVTTPNMNLIQPEVGVDTGLTWENAQNANATTIDLHNHTPGYGTQITPLGLDINADLTFNGNNATFMRSVRFSPQTVAFSAAADIGCIYVVGVDLYYRDVNGNNIQITSGGTVNATSSGIASGTATASFVSGVLVVNAAANTPANIQGGSILLGNNVANSKYLTLSPPSAMPANYQLVLPSIPGIQSFLTLDTSGNFGTTLTTALANLVGTTMSTAGADAIATTMDVTGADAIAVTMDQTGTDAIATTMGSAGANIIAANITRGLNTGLQGEVGYVSANGSTNATTDVLFGSFTLVTAGRPVSFGVFSNGGGYISITGNAPTASATFDIYRNATIVGGFTIQVPQVLSVPSVGSTTSYVSTYYFPSSSLNGIDLTVSSGTQTYFLYGRVNAASSGVAITNSFFTAYEL